MTINRNDKSTSISTQMDSLIPASKISNLTQGMFVGAVSDNFDERIDQKIFHAEIVVDSAKVSAEMKAYQPIPMIVEFTHEEGKDILKETIEENHKRVKRGNKSCRQGNGQNKVRSILGLFDKGKLGKTLTFHKKQKWQENPAIFT